MLTRCWLHRDRPKQRLRSGLALLAAAGLVSLVALPGPAGAAVRQENGELARSAAADGIRANQDWVLAMLHAEAAWSVTQGAGVTVAVIDSGVNPYVTDLRGSVTTGPDYTGVTTSPASVNWGVHGTWMASLIAGHGHDGGTSGVIGMAPQARILSIRVIPDKRRPALQPVRAGAGDRHPAVAGRRDQLRGGPRRAGHQHVDRLQRAERHGPDGAAAGLRPRRGRHRLGRELGRAGGPGRAGEAPESFPANYPGVISVGAVSSNGAVAGFSSENLSVQVAAPGVSVPAQGRDGQYWWVSGTSPACALVAGVAALIKAKYPGLAPDLVASALTSTTTDRPAGGYDSQVGFGIVDAAAALARAGRLAGARPAEASFKATARYHGALPPQPVGPRGSGQLVLFALLALTSLVLAAAAGTRLAVLRRAASRANK